MDICTWCDEDYFAHCEECLACCPDEHSVDCPDYE